MILIIITVFSFFLVGIGFFITEKNAPYLLSGFNTMSKEEQDQVDLKPLLAFFKKFHINLGVSQALIGFTLYFLDYENLLGIFIGTYSILGYIYFIIKSAPFQPKQNSKVQMYLGVGVLSICFLGIIGLFYYGNVENQLTIEENQIVISGMYGEKIPLERIQSIQLTEGLPTLTKRINGFSSSGLKKGKFKTADKEIIKLLINQNVTQYILIDKIKGKDVYYNSSNEDVVSVYKELRSKLDPTLFGD